MISPMELYRSKYIADRGGFVGTQATQFDPQSLSDIIQFKMQNRQQQRGRPRPQKPDPVGSERTASFYPPMR